jgi:galactokinase
VDTAEAPGRCTLVGEHVDYADGVVVCAAIDLAVAVALRQSEDGRWRVSSEGRTVERAELQMCGDIGDRPLAALRALKEHGVDVPPMEIALAASLPEGAGLASSAAVCCAVIVAAVRLSGFRLGAVDVADTALYAERDIVGVPCGPLDQRAIVDAPASGVLLLDCRDLSESGVPWLSDVTLVACHTGEAHDVGGEEYRHRRDEADAARRLLGAASWRTVTTGDLASAHLPRTLAMRARHIVTETARAISAGDALRHHGVAELGALMSASHASLRDDYEVSTPILDAVVAAAEAVPGCHGSRLVGAGFGGTAIALVDAAAADDCRRVMSRAAGRDGDARPHTWALRPAPGLAHRAADAIS